MNIACLRMLTIVLLVATTGVPARGEEDRERARSRDPLVEAVAKSPVDLRDAVDQARGTKGTALRAGFARDTEGALVLRVLVHSSSAAERAFEEWTGIVYDGCWVSRRRVLAESDELAEAERLHGLIAKSSRSLAAAIIVSRGPQREDKTMPGLAISIEPTQEDGQVRFVSLVALEKRVRRVTLDPATGGILSAVPTTARPPRLEVAAEGRRIPELSVPEGIWFNAQEPPTLAGWRGHPVLVVVADPG